MYMSSMSSKVQKNLLEMKLGEALREAENKGTLEDIVEKVFSSEELDRRFMKKSLLTRISRSIKPSAKRLPDEYWWAKHELPFRLKQVEIPTREDACVVMVVDAWGERVLSKVISYEEKRGMKEMNALIKRAQGVIAAVKREMHRRYEYE